MGSAEVSLDIPVIFKITVLPQLISIINVGDTEKLENVLVL